VEETNKCETDECRPQVDFIDQQGLVLRINCLPQGYVHGIV